MTNRNRKKSDSLSAWRSSVLKIRATQATVVVSLILISGGTCLGEQDPSSLSVPYDVTAGRTIGDAVNITFPYSALGRCITYDNADVKWDGGGANDSDGSLRLILSDLKETETTDLILGFETKSKINAGIFNVDSSFNADTTTQKFRSRESNTLTLEFRAYADYGRRMIEKYALDKEAPSFTNDIDKFRAVCGTHFLRGTRNESYLRLLVKIDTSSRAGKDALDVRFKRTIGGGISIKKITGEAGANFSANYKSLMDFAKKTGNVTIEYSARGGPGIAAAGASARKLDPSDIDKFGDIISSASSLFNQSNSGVVSYILHPNTAFGAPGFDFNIERIGEIGTLTRKLIMLNDASARYSKIKSEDAPVFEKYFRNFAREVDLARLELVQIINVCSSGAAASHQLVTY